MNRVRHDRVSSYSPVGSYGRSPEICLIRWPGLQHGVVSQVLKIKKRNKDSSEKKDNIFTFLNLLQLNKCVCINVCIAVYLCVCVYLKTKMHT